MLAPRLLMVHDTRASSEHNVPKLTRRQQLHNPLLHVAQLDVVPRANDASLVQAAIELNDDFAVAVVVYFFEFTNVAFLREKLSASWLFCLLFVADADSERKRKKRG